jgi:cytochrome c-type biogenesis protein CcmH/NrfG
VVFPVAILALQENDTALAEKQLKHLLTLDFPDKSAPYYYLGQIAEESKRGDEALAYYSRLALASTICRRRCAAPPSSPAGQARRGEQPTAAGGSQRETRNCACNC